jgi:hypothetical protein
MGGDTGLGFYNAMLAGDYDAYRELRELDLESEIADAIKMHLLEQAKSELEEPKELSDNPAARIDRHKELMAAYNNGFKFSQQFGLEQIKKKHGF